MGLKKHPFPSNLHTHTLFCDGRNSVEEYVQAAIAMQFKSLGFSGHSYLSFGLDFCLRSTTDYISEVQRIKKMYESKIAIYLGIECDYFSDITAQKAKALGLDFTIGSVHYVADKDRKNFYCLDHTPAEFERGIKELGKGSVQTLVENYYQLILDMVDTQQPDIIGHLDLVKKLNHNNCYFDETSTWYKDCLKRVCKHLSGSKSVVEINTGGMARGYTSFPYPSSFILELLLAYNIPITINSDAHQVDKLDYHFAETVEFLKEMKCNKVQMYCNNKWTDWSL